MDCGTAETNFFAAEEWEVGVLLLRSDWQSENEAAVALTGSAQLACCSVKGSLKLARFYRTKKIAEEKLIAKSRIVSVLYKSLTNKSDNDLNRRNSP